MALEELSNLRRDKRSFKLLYACAGKLNRGITCRRKFVRAKVVTQFQSESANKFSSSLEKLILELRF